MIYRVRHVTTLHYAEPVLMAHHLGHLAPRSFGRQTCTRWALRVNPKPVVQDDRTLDYFGNQIAYFTVESPHAKLVVDSLSRVKVEPLSLPDPEASPPWDEVAALLPNATAMLDAAEFCFDSPYVPSGPEVLAYARPSFPPGRPLLAGLIDLNDRIFHDFTYDPEATTLATPLARVMAERRGVCQDFAHLALACLRSVGLSARYVSGYLLTRPPPGKTKLKGSDASHAWVSAFVPELGWVDLDPTNACLPSDEHIITAWGRDYGDVSPLSGVVLGGGEQSLKVAVDVEPI